MNTIPSAARRESLLGNSGKRAFLLFLAILSTVSAPLTAEETGENNLPIAQALIEKATRAQALVDAIQARYDTVESFRAEFRQTSFHPKLRTEIEDGGEVVYQRPNRMRWDYTLRRKYSVITSGENRVWIVEPKKKKATIYSFDSQLAMTFLAGLGRLAKEFDFTLQEEIPEAFSEEGQPLIGLSLTPKTLNPYVRSVLLVLRKNVHEVIGTEVIDSAGKPTRTHFTQRAYGVKIDPNRLFYEPPEDWEFMDPQGLTTPKR